MMSKLGKCIKIHKSLEPIKWLVGKWKSVNAHVEYPTIKPYNYRDKIQFDILGVQPLLTYKSRAWLEDWAATEFHYEHGFLRIDPETQQLCFLLAHNFGLNSVEHGEVKNCEMCFKSSDISRNSFAREPAVCELTREYKLIGDKLHFLLYMATDRTPLTKHLTVTYKRYH